MYRLIKLLSILLNKAVNLYKYQNKKCYFEYSEILSKNKITKEAARCETLAILFTTKVSKGFYF